MGEVMWAGSLPGIESLLDRSNSLQTELADKLFGEGILFPAHS
jgi:hypothetical protein